MLKAKLRPDIQKIYDYMNNLYGNGPDKISLDANFLDLIAQRREVIDKYADVDNYVFEIPENITVKKLKVRGIDCEWVIDKNSDPNKRLLYLHGGGFIGGSINSHRPIAAKLAELAGISVLLVGYSLAPENSYPQGLDDCYETYDHMVDFDHNNNHIKADKTFVSGDSAGGNLSLALLLKLKKNKQQQPNAVTVISAVTDFTGKSPSLDTMDGLDPILKAMHFRKGMPLVYLFGNKIIDMNTGKLKKGKAIQSIITQKNKLIKDPFVSPLYGDLEGLPPISMHVGDVEIVRDDSIRFADKAKLSGVDASLKVWPYMMHVFIAFYDFLPEARQCIQEMVDFIIFHSE